MDRTVQFFGIMFFYHLDRTAGTIDKPCRPDHLCRLLGEHARPAADTDDLHGLSAIIFPSRFTRTTLTRGYFFPNAASTGSATGKNAGDAASSSTVAKPVPSRICGSIYFKIRAGSPQRITSPCAADKASPIRPPGKHDLPVRKEQARVPKADPAGGEDDVFCA